jgi:hypothetical protein
MTSTCTTGEYCGFFVQVTTVEGSQSCQPVITGSSWVSTVVFSSYGSTSETLPAATATWSEYPSLYAGGKRACLYAEIGDVLVAEATYEVPVPAPCTHLHADANRRASPRPDAGYGGASDGHDPHSGPSVSQPDRRSGGDPSVDQEKYGHRWTKGSRRTVRCPVRSSDAQLGCFASAPTQVQTVTIPSTSPAGSTDFCSTHACIPNYDNGTGSTVQCSDGTYSHSGGKQGACSHHGGVGHSAFARRAFSLTRSARASRHQATLTRELDLISSLSS